MFFYFYQVLTALNKLKIVSEVTHDNLKKRLKVVCTLHSYIHTQEEDIFCINKGFFSRFFYNKYIKKEVGHIRLLKFIYLGNDLFYRVDLRIITRI